MKLERAIDYIKTLNLDRIVALNHWVKLAVLVVFMLMVVIVGNFLLIDGQKASLAQAQNQERVLKQQLIASVKRAKTLPELESQVNVLEAQYQELLARLPEGRELPRLIEELSDIAHQTGLTVRTITPSPLQHLDQYSILNVRLLVEGTYQQLTQLLVDVSQMPRIMIIQDYRVVPMASNNRNEPLLQMTLNMRTFSLSSDQRQKATIRR